MKNLLKIILSLSIIVFLTNCSDSDDPKKILPQLSIDDVTAKEGEVLQFTISLNEISSDTIKVRYRAEDVTTVAGSDYYDVDATAQIEINPGETSVKIYIISKTDAIAEGDEILKIILSSPVNADILDGEGIGTIQNKTVATVNYFLKAKIDGKQWTAQTGSIFGFGYSDFNSSIVGYGTDGDSQLSFIFSDTPTAKTYGIETVSASDENHVSVFFSPNLFSSSGLGASYMAQPGGQVIVTKFDVIGGVVEGTFSFTATDSDTGISKVFTEGTFKVPFDE